jgi:hypothetical protein
MEKLAQEMFPGLKSEQILTIGAGRALPSLSWSEISEIVLLWPDSNGMGWSSIERDILSRARVGTPLLAISGRRRCWKLDGQTLRGLWWRRALEKTLAFEFAFTIAFGFVTPALVAYDWLRRKS